MSCAKKELLVSQLDEAVGRFISGLRVQVFVTHTVFVHLTQTTTGVFSYSTCLVKQGHKSVRYLVCMWPSAGERPANGTKAMWVTE